MAITLGSLVEILMVGNIPSGQVMNAWQYSVDGSAFLVEPVQIAEAWWNHVKATYRAIPVVGYTEAFLTVLLRELNNPAGDYAEYAVPIGERAGTRSATAQGSFLQPYAAVGARLTVGTRITRPGQKRFWGFEEGDQQNGVVEATPLAAVNAHMAVMTEPMILGAPAATIVLNPIVTKRDAQGEVTANQPVLGWVTNGYMTTQNSRKYGRGS